MANYQEARTKLTNTRSNKLKSAEKKGTDNIKNKQEKLSR